MHDAGRMANHPDLFKKKLKNRLNRIEGQVRGISRMIENNVYCDDVLHQISAVQSALNACGRELLAAHLRSCVVEQIKAGDEKVVDELLKTLSKLMR